MPPTHHSEYRKIKSICIKSAKSAFVSETILDQQWKALNYLEKPNYKLAIKEYDAFEEFIKTSTNTIYRFPFDPSVAIDSIYCRDASIATDFGVIICNMGKSGRVNEPIVQQNFFQKNNIPILGQIKSPGTLEGGDVAWIDEKTLAVGHSYRTNENGIRQLKKLLEPRGIEIIVAELPHYKGPSDVFHLMSILSPIDKNLAVIFSPLMPIKFRRELLGRAYHFIEVTEDEFETMGCNVLALGPKKCMIVKSNPKTTAALIKAGCEVFEYEGKNISVLGGGGPTCLTRPLLRE